MSSSLTASADTTHASGVMAAYLIPNQLVRVQVLGGVLTSDPSHTQIGLLSNRKMPPYSNYSGRMNPVHNTVPWSNGNDAWFTSRKRWFNSIRDYFDRNKIPSKDIRLSDLVSTRMLAGSTPALGTEKDNTPSWSSGVLACLSRRRSSVQIRSGVQTLDGMRRFPPVLLEKQHASAGHWRAQVAVTHPLPSCGGSTPSRRTDNMARSSSGKDARSSFSRHGFDSHTGH